MIYWLLLFLTALLLVSGLVVVQFFWSHRRIRSTASKLPCPPTLPLLGNLLFFTGGNKSITTNLNKFSTQYKGLFCLWSGPLPLFFISETTDAKTLLNSTNCLEKDDLFYAVLRTFAGNGIITAPVRIWKKTHRLIAPIFNHKNVKLFIPEFNEISQQLCEELDCGELIDPKEKLFSASIDSVTRTLIGETSFDSKFRHDVQLVLESLGELVLIRLVKIWLNVEILFKLLYRSELKLLLDRMNDLYGRYYQKLEARANELQSLNRMTNMDEEQDSLRTNIMNVTLKHPSLGFEDHKWTDEMATILGAGSDTTSNTLRFLFVTLANHPEVQTKIRKEISEVMGDSNRDVTLSELEAMSYLNCVLLETMRLHGVVPIIGRRVTKDLKLSSCTIPEGSHVFVNLNALGWNPDKFPEPDRFMPERFLENKEAKQYFLPFSAGPRRCPGDLYSMLFMKTVVVHLLRKFELTSPVRLEDIEYVMRIVMMSENVLPIKCRKL